MLGVLSLEFFIAFRYLRSKNREKFISITAVFSFLGIALGVAALIVITSVMNGFKEDFVNKILGINSHVSVYSMEREFKNYQKAVQVILSDTNVKNVTPIIEAQVMLVSDDNSSAALIRGIEKHDLMRKDNISVVPGEYNFSKNSIVLGTELANKLRVAKGDTIRVIYPEGNTTIFGMIPAIKTYTIDGTFTSGMYEYDANLAFIPLSMAQMHFKYAKDAVGTLEVYLHNSDADYQNIALQLKNADFDVNLFGWKQSNGTFISALNIERNVMIIILALIILIAAFNIISSLTMLVNDKKKQIALLRTIGFTKGSIMKIYCICGCAIGFVGTLVGNIVGISLAANITNIKNMLEKLFDVELFSPTIYFLSELPSKIMPRDVIFITCFSLIMSFLSTLYPSYKASKTNPAEVLRYE